MNFVDNELAYDFADDEIVKMHDTSKVISISHSQYFPSVLDCTDYAWTLEENESNSYMQLKEKLEEICEKEL